MAAVRRLYIYLISAISLQAMAWALIALARNLLINSLKPPTESIAFEIAVVIIGLPIFLAHWLWAQRLTRSESGEVDAGLRRFYLYATLAGFLGPVIANGFYLLTSLFAETSIYPNSAYLRPGSRVLYHLIPIVILGVIGWYHRNLLAAEQKVANNRGSNATIERLFRLGFSAAGLTMTCLGTIHILRGLLFKLVAANPGSIRSTYYEGLGVAGVRVLVGVVVWLFFWLWSQRLFTDPASEERGSALRKFYLYGAVFAGVLGTVGYATTILAGLLRRALSLPSQGDLRIPIPIMAVMVVVWAYHAYILRQDQRQVNEAPRQAGIRRIYLYLVAGVGLAALLVGLGGVISVFLRTFDQTLGSNLRGQLAWFTSAVFAGLPVWLFHWRQAQRAALLHDESGENERTSLVRKIYLYFYIFAATLTVLSGLVYIVYRIFSLLLGEPAPKLSELGQAIAFCIIAVGVWLYHGASLRMDGRLAQGRRSQRLHSMQALLIGFEPEGTGDALLEAIKRTLPGLNASIISPGDPVEGQPSTEERVAQADLLILPWNSILEGSELFSRSWIEALRQSSAKKLLVPAPLKGWEIAGVEQWEPSALVQQAVHAVSQIAAGEEVKPIRPLGAGAVIGIIIAALIGLSFLMSVINMIVSGF